MREGLEVSIDVSKAKSSVHHTTADIRVSVEFSLRYGKHRWQVASGGLNKLEVDP